MTVSDTPTPRRGGGRPAVDPAVRFWSKVDRSGGPDACWPWTAATSGGYGSFRLAKGRSVTAHSYAKLLDTGIPCPPGNAAQHTCRTPLTDLCCNPGHIVYGTHGAGGVRHLRGAEHPSAKLTNDQVRAIRTRVANGEKRADMAAEYQVSYSSIVNLVLGSRRTDAGGPPSTHTRRKGTQP